MVKKRGKPVSFDAMVKFFMQAYQIPTKRDVDKILKGMERIEGQLRTLMSQTPSASRKKRTPREKSEGNATIRVLEVIRKRKDGIDVPGIHAETGFEDKKLRNIIFRLHKLGKIKRKDRGVYVGA
ncbi:MAG: hypothetical protein JRI76_00220 [Deltaproteobacteria bacterium]|nr:hypothetical protein [Deltaproteobacteria bacterium]MBW1955151.1 hypothetical protein [Deltaproteobacteria bacterium]MBW2040433.1 hypothetical protein [Deltaproteobacteria bacterium]MBW2131858.1 hypothetical protein [Deltaproteobacteria bacterium]